MAAARRRKSLADLDLGDVQEQPKPTPPPAPRAARASRQAGTPEVRKSAPRWATMERIDLRLRPDQAQAVTELRKRISAGRRTRSERITDNTVIRLALDLLLTEFAEDLPGAGDTEEQLLAALFDRARGGQHPQA